MGEYKMPKKPRTEDYADLRREREVREELNSAISALEKISNNDTKLEEKIDLITTILDIYKTMRRESIDYDTSYKAKLEKELDYLKFRKRYIEEQPGIEFMTPEQAQKIEKRIEEERNSQER